MRSLSKTRRFRQAVIAWCSGVESNHRHRDFQSLALPTELPLRRHSSSARRRARTTQGPARAERVLWNWCIEMGLNHRCAGLQPAALPLSYRCMKQAMEVEVCQVAQASRPGRTCFLANWSGRWDSNPRPVDWQPTALPLSYTRKKSAFGPSVARRTRRRRSLVRTGPLTFPTPWMGEPKVGGHSSRSWL